MKNAPAWAPGQGEEDITEHSPHTAPDLQHQALIDHRLVFLACAAARFDLVEAGAMTLDDAFSRDFVERFREIGRLACHCEREIGRNIDRTHLAIRDRQLRDWRWGRR
jgi:hypothetical protein